MSEDFNILEQRSLTLLPSLICLNRERRLLSQELKLLLHPAY